MWILSQEMIYADNSQTRIWRADVTCHDIVYGNIMESDRSSWDGKTITLSIVTTVFPEEYVPSDSKFSIQYLKHASHFRDRMDTIGAESVAMARISCILLCINPSTSRRSK